MNSPSEQDLLLGAKRWDLNTLGMIYDCYSPGIYSYAMRMLGDDSLAEDCVSETFTRFLKILRSGQGPTEYLKAYLYRIAHNWITDFYRRQPNPPLDLDDSLQDADQLLVEGQLDDQLEQQQVRLALLSLTPDQRQVINLRFFESWENQEVAAALGKPVGAIKALQHRALNTLRKILLGNKSEGTNGIK